MLRRFCQKGGSSPFRSVGFCRRFASTSTRPDDTGNNTTHQRGGSASHTSAAAHTADDSTFALWEKGLEQRALGDLSGCAKTFKVCFELQKKNFDNANGITSSAVNSINQSNTKTLAEELGLVLLALSQQQQELQQAEEAASFFRFALSPTNVADRNDSSGVLGEEEGGFVQTMTRASSSFHSRGRTSDALACMQPVLTFLEGRTKGDDESKDDSRLQLAARLTFTGTLLYKLGRWADAVSMFEKASFIYEGTIGGASKTAAVEGEAATNAAQKEEGMDDTRQQLATVYNNLGLAYHKLNDRLAALGMFKKCLGVYEVLRNAPTIEAAAAEIRRRKYNEDAAASMSNIGMIYADQGTFKTALDYYHQCAELQEKLAGEAPSTARSMALGETYNTIGHLYFRSQDLDQALLYVTKFKTIAEEQHQHSSSSSDGEGGDAIDLVAGAWSSIGLLREHQRTLDLALEAYDKCFALQKAHHQRLLLAAREEAESKNGYDRDAREKAKRRRLENSMASTQLKIGTIYRRLAHARAPAAGGGGGGGGTSSSTTKDGIDLQEQHNAAAIEALMLSIQLRETSSSSSHDDESIQQQLSKQEMQRKQLDKVEAARCHNFLGMCLLKANRGVEAQGHLKQCLALIGVDSRQKKNPVKSGVCDSAQSPTDEMNGRRKPPAASPLWSGRDVATVYLSLGEASKRDGDLEGATEHYLEASALLERSAPLSVELLASYSELAELFDARKIIHKGEYYRRQAAEMQKKYEARMMSGSQKPKQQEERRQPLRVPQSRIN